MEIADGRSELFTGEENNETINLLALLQPHCSASKGLWINTLHVYKPNYPQGDGE